MTLTKKKEKTCAHYINTFALNVLSGYFHFFSLTSKASVSIEAIILDYFLRKVEF